MSISNPAVYPSRVGASSHRSPAATTPHAADSITNQCPSFKPPNASRSVSTDADDDIEICEIRSCSAFFLFLSGKQRACPKRTSRLFYPSFRFQRTKQHTIWQGTQFTMHGKDRSSDAMAGLEKTKNGSPWHRHRCDGFRSARMRVLSSDERARAR